jgi:5-methylcytosine-specific restriction endonuclease McrA
MQEQSVFVQVGSWIQHISEWILLLSVMVIGSNLLLGLLALDALIMLPAWAWLALKWYNCLLAVFIEVRGVVYMTIHGAASSHRKVDVFAMVGAAGALLFIFADGSIRTPTWGLAVPLLAIILCRVLTIEIRHHRQRGKQQQTFSSGASPFAHHMTRRCGMCGEPGYELCLRCKGKYKDELQRINYHLRRAQQVGEPATLTLVEWIQMRRLYRDRCCHAQRCGGSYEVIDHVIPIGQGDSYTGGTIAHNCRPICRSCNSRKSNCYPGDEPERKHVMSKRKR